MASEDITLIRASCYSMDTNDLRDLLDDAWSDT